MFKNKTALLYKNFFSENFYAICDSPVRAIWTYKNVDEKLRTFLRRSKHVKKRTKTDEKRILCLFTLTNIDF